MKQQAAPTATSIQVITAFYLAGTTCLIVGTYFKNILLIPSLIMGMIAVLCYVYSPRFYAISANKLIIIYRIGEKEFGPIRSCWTIPEERQFGIRLWGNGGLFSATGIFWSRSYGVFHAYVTASGPGGLVMVETPGKKIVISPEHPQKFVQYWRESQTSSRQVGDPRE